MSSQPCVDDVRTVPGGGHAEERRVRPQALAGPYRTVETSRFVTGKVLAPKCEKRSPKEESWVDNRGAMILKQSGERAEEALPGWVQGEPHAVQPLRQAEAAQHALEM